MTSLRKVPLEAWWWLFSPEAGIHLGDPSRRETSPQQAALSGERVTHGCAGSAESILDTQGLGAAWEGMDVGSWTRRRTRDRAQGTHRGWVTGESVGDFSLLVTEDAGKASCVSRSQCVFVCEHGLSCCVSFWRCPDRRSCVFTRCHRALRRGGEVKAAQLFFWGWLIQVKQEMKQHLCVSESINGKNPDRHFRSNQWAVHALFLE